MNNNSGLPSSDELAELPNRSIAVYAIRCALRVQPLLTSAELVSTEYKKAVLMLNSNLEILKNTSNDFVAAAAAISRATSIIKAYAEDSAINSDAHKVIVGSVESIEHAVDTYVTYSNTSNSAAKAAFAAEAVADKAYDVYTAPFGDFAFSEYVLGVYARADYTRLKEHKTEVTDASEKGPLGNLWHGSPPDWYIEAKEHYNNTIAEWERELGEDVTEKGNLSGSAKINFSSSGILSYKLPEEIESESDAELIRRINSSEPEPLISVYFDNSGFTEEEISECLEYLSESYRSMGGIGLKVVNGNSLIPETEEASQ